MSEYQEQVNVMAWAKLMTAQYPELELLHSSQNGAPLGSGKVAAIRGHQLRLAGLLPGLPDLHLPVARRGYHSLWIELKVEGRKPRENQVEILELLNAAGNFATVCNGADDAIMTLQWYLEKEGTE